MGGMGSTGRRMNGAQDVCVDAEGSGGGKVGWKGCGCQEIESFGSIGKSCAAVYGSAGDDAGGSCVGM